MSTRQPRESFNLFQWGQDGKNGSGRNLSKSSRDILKKQIFSQESESSGALDSHDPEQSLDVVARKKEKKEFDWGSLLGMFDPKEEKGVDADKLMETARSFVASGDTQDKESNKTMDNLQKELKAISEQVGKKLEASDIKGLDPVCFYYFLEKEDEKKNPSWKRRQHRYMTGLDYEMVYSLHDALYLAELSYVDTIEEIKAGLDNFHGKPWELIYSTTDSEPRHPAHFLCLKKQASEHKKDGINLPWAKKDKAPLEVLLVVRGTKDLGDMLSDALLDCADYRKGKAHDGICQSGKWIVEKHLPLLKHIWEESGCPKLKVNCVGHSLGAGTASIACLELNDQKFIESTCIGFGCPALLDKTLSESCEDFITTIVNDSDCVPRMSGETIVNMVLDANSINCEDEAVTDVHQLLDVINANTPSFIKIDKGVCDGVQTFIKDKSNQGAEDRKKAIDTPRQEVVLFPPGKCIHFFRDGVGISANYVPSTFFSEIDVTRRMVDDHLIPSGYNKTFQELMRDHTGDSRFQFPHDVNRLRHAKPEKKVNGKK